MYTNTGQKGYDDYGNRQGTSTLFDISGVRQMAKEGDGRMQYCFYGWESADTRPVNEKYRDIHSPRELYDILSEIWCADTCAPRMRDKWSRENKTLGQCSITAFLAQDIFGGKVYGIFRPDGSYHCYNAVGNCCFDLTSEQFGAEAGQLIYEDNPEQFRETHFANEEKRLRYEYLRERLDAFLDPAADAPDK